jgi:signal transduction histidine kinase
MNTIFWVNFLIGGILLPYAFGMFLAFLLKPRYKRLSKPILSLIFMFSDMPGIWIRVTHPGTPLFELIGDLQMVWAIVFVLLAFHDLWWKELLAILLFFGTLSISEALVMAFLSGSGISFNASFATYEMFLHQTLVCIVSLSIYTILALLWRKIFQHSDPPHNAWLYMLFPISQAIMLREFPNALLYYGDSVHLSSLILDGILAFAADVALFYVLLNEGEKDEMERQLAEMKYLQEIEQQHYRDMEQQNKTVAKIRHDINNQLAAALYLKTNGNAGEASQIISQVQNELKQAATGRWCGNQIVNAVMAEKEAVCTEKGIQLKAELAIGELPSIQPVHLCSVFSNLLDNAIAAAGDHGTADSKPVIDLRAAVRGDYLQIRISNPSAKPAKAAGRATVLDRHGHGQEIISDIAEKYNGSFLTDWKDGIYTVMLALQL